MTILLKQLHLWFGDVCRHIEGEEEAKRLYSKLSNTSHPRIKGDALRSRCAQQATNSVWGKPDPALSRFQNDALVAARVLAFLNSKRLPVTAVRATLLAHQITDAASLSQRECAQRLFDHWTQPQSPPCPVCAANAARGSVATRSPQRAGVGTGREGNNEVENRIGGLSSVCREPIRLGSTVNVRLGLPRRRSGRRAEPIVAASLGRTMHEARHGQPLSSELLLLVGAGEGTPVLPASGEQQRRPIGVVLADEASSVAAKPAAGSRWCFSDAVESDPAGRDFARSTDCCTLRWTPAKGRHATATREISRGRVLLRASAAAAPNTAASGAATALLAELSGRARPGGLCGRPTLS
ncbi:hypothetical protein EMIHUDRAFT_253753 [Emiliania huxleyi CCMP1516]|uniref:DNA2/NAM7 helicase helicase domain-containing protein n=2 Tax=Emiliania huxleyi TaxID=2903 RepID=A0A0D3K3G4_EMIH1|nr:hypothetical protein EMIHUDRAFT_253753 [Emiliania huxleyi CCMP1516]EOD30299.1 hypothetical protein EMIHUDRAFT_253753 [Emiliania huxleyi CCMP1516]|eukprot:XP_005782728.1 hypothetical protein EMIHUDRAFT_253753 [Emiliania huxleyi CCMP1516]